MSFDETELVLETEMRKMTKPGSGGAESVADVKVGFSNPTTGRSVGGSQGNSRVGTRMTMRSESMFSATGENASAPPVKVMKGALRGANIPMITELG